MVFTLLSILFVDPCGDESTSSFCHSSITFREDVGRRGRGQRVLGRGGVSVTPLRTGSREKYASEEYRGICYILC